MPGRCPACNQVYTDETLSFCPNDGTPLAREQPSSYDPQATLLNVQPPQTNPPAPPQGYYQQGAGQAPPPGWQQQTPPYDQQPPYGQQPPPYGQQQQQYTPYGGQSAAGVAAKSKLPLIIGILALVLIGGGIGLYFLLKDNSSSERARVDVSTNNSNTTTTTTTSSPRTTTTLPTPSTTTTTTTTTGGSYTNDQKHKLFQAVGITRDNALILDVMKKIGLVDSTGNPNEAFQPFIKEHLNWAMSNAAWVQEHNDPARARAYVRDNL